MASTDAWMREYDECRRLADDTFLALTDRQDALRAGGDAARLTAITRRKLNGVNAKLDRLTQMLPGSDASEGEKNRRQDLLNRLRQQAEQVAASLATKNVSGGPGPAPSWESAPAQETARTAGRDERGLLAMQREMMDEQDEEIDELSRLVSSTKNIALTVNEELDLHNRLLDDLEDDVDHTYARLRKGIKLAKRVARKAGNCSYLACIVLLVVGLVVLILFCLKVIK
mmetsp:Transcript_24706/g.84508  ORF Transcript_24706/g.84508 Transcript_24706/m.84508 type:complete len:228 (-) Transcript_24706:19-702(-)